MALRIVMSSNALLKIGMWFLLVGLLSNSLPVYCLPANVGDFDSTMPERKFQPSGWSHKVLVQQTSNKSTRSMAKLIDYDVKQFDNVMVKFTYVGVQDEMVPGLFISTKEKLPDLSAFKAHRKPGLHYGNDDAKAFYVVRLTPEQLLRLVRTILLRFGPSYKAGIETKPGISHSLSILDNTTTPQNYFEVTLTSAETKALLEKCASEMAPADKKTAESLREYATSFGG